MKSLLTATLFIIIIMLFLIFNISFSEAQEGMAQEINGDLVGLPPVVVDEVPEPFPLLRRDCLEDYDSPACYVVDYRYLKYQAHLERELAEAQKARRSMALAGGIMAGVFTVTLMAIIVTEQLRVDSN